MDAADGRTRVVIGRGGDGTGVQHHDLGLGGGGGARQSLIGQLAFNGGAVGLGGAASEVFYKETAHGSIISALGVGPAPFSTGAAAPVTNTFAAFLVALRSVTGRLLPRMRSAVGSRLGKRLLEIAMKRRILLVDDELAILLTLKAILEMNGFEVETAASAREAEQKLNQRHL